MKTKFQTTAFFLALGFFFLLIAPKSHGQINLPHLKPPQLQLPQLQTPQIDFSQLIGKLPGGEEEAQLEYIWAVLPGIPRSVRIPVKQIDGEYIFQDDIVISPRQIVSRDLARPSQDSEFRIREQGLYGQSNVTVDGEYLWLWQYGKIPYTFHSNVSMGVRMKIMNAINRINRETDGFLQLVPRRGERDYVRFRVDESLPGVGRSKLGRCGGRQDIELKARIGVGSLMHEILHAAGVYHEQTRPDRDYYVNIEWSNIKASAWGNFFYFPTAAVGRVYSPYDYSSIMHYSRNAFCDRDGGVCSPTIIPTRNPNARIGQRDSLSYWDVRGLQVMYGRQRWYISDDGTSQWIAINSSRISAEDLAFGDFNGDGITDVFRSANGKWYISYSGTGGWVTVNRSDIGKGSLLFGDFNGDGETDVFYANGRDWKVSYSATSGWQRINRSSITKNKLMTGDFNGDGRSDIFYANGDKWKVSYSGSGGWRWLNRSGTTKSSLIVGDFNGDRTSDILLTTGSKWKITWGGRGGWVTLNTSEIEKESLLWGDFNGDGKSDLFFANGSDWKVSYGAVTGWTRINKSRITKPNLKVGNFDGDNKADVFSGRD